MEKEAGVKHGGLLFDFAVFLIEAGLLFAAGWSLSSGITTFVSLGLLLSLDMAWGIISHKIHFPGKKSHVLGWSAINLVAILMAVLVVVSGWARNNYSDEHGDCANCRGLLEMLGFLLSLREN